MSDYVTLEDVKAFLGKETTGDDQHLQTIIDEEVDWLEEQTDTVFNASTNTNKTLDAVDNVDGVTLYLDTWLYSLNTITNGDGTSVTSGQVVLEPRDGPPYYAIKIRSDQSIAWTYGDYHEDAITVNGAWGYSATVPPRVQKAIKRLVKHTNHSRMQSGDLDRPLLTGDGITIMPNRKPADVWEIIEFYRPKAGWGK